jgi:TctA family transporter
MKSLHPQILTAILVVGAIGILSIINDMIDIAMAGVVGIVGLGLADMLSMRRKIKPKNSEEVDKNQE